MSFRHAVPVLLVCMLIGAVNLRAQTPNPAVEEFAVRLAAESAANSENLLRENQNLLTAELAAALLLKGRAKMSANDFLAAARFFDLSLRVAEKAGDNASVAAALRNLGGASGIQGNFVAALDYFKRAVAAYENMPDENGLLQALRGIGNAESALGNYERGIEAFKRSLELAEKTLDKTAQSNAHSSLNVVYQNVGDFDRAEQHGRQALALANETGDKRARAASLSNLATLLASRGDFRAALDFNEQALQLAQETNQPERVALMSNNIGDIYLRQNDDAAAENYFRRGLALREQIGDKDGIARSNLRLGELKIKQNDFAAALEFLNRSVRLRETDAPEPAALAAALSRTGDVYFRQNDLTRAGDFYNRAIEIADPVGERETVAEILIAAARFHLAKSERAAAQAKINRAIEIAAASNLREILWQAQTVAGEIALAANDKQRAQDHFAAAIKIIEDSRFFVAGGERERQQFFESRLQPFHALVDLHVAEKNSEAAFAVAERAKARVLLDVLQTGRAPLNKTMTADERAAETKLKNAIFTFNSQLQTEAAKPKPDAARLADLKTQIGNSRTALESFTTRLYVAHPELKLQRGETAIASAVELNKLLPDSNSAMVEFFVTENRTFAFVLTRGQTKANLQVVPITMKKGDLTRTVESLRRKIAARDLRFADEARKIYDLLLAPVSKQLAGKTRLIIAPDAALWELPFQALIDSQGKYLIESAAVSYAPSLSVLAEIERRNVKSIENQTLLAFGNPANSIQNAGDGKNPRPVAMGGETFADLPEAARLVKTLETLFKAKVRRNLVLTGTQATEAEFKKSAADFQILHLATHGVLNDASPLYSYILLANDAKNAEDGRLEAWELMRMNLTANLVVLSACESGRGRIASGEGIIGLSWAFFVAGSPTTVASQWKVESASTTDLMLGFYRQLENQKCNRSEALRQSALVLLSNKKYAHPFYWAGFIVINDSIKKPV